MSIFKTQSKTDLQDISESFGDELHSTPTRAPLPADMPAPARDKRQKSIVQSDLHITGNIQKTGILEFAGQIDGDVSSDTLIISHEGTITGRLSTKHLISSGSISGKISAENVQLKSMSQTKAAMRCKRITVEYGAVIEGKVQCLPNSAPKSKQIVVFCRSSDRVLETLSPEIRVREPKNLGMDFKKKRLKNNQTRPSSRLATWIAAIVILAALVELFNSYITV